MTVLPVAHGLVLAALDVLTLHQEHWRGSLGEGAEADGRSDG